MTKATTEAVAKIIAPEAFVTLRELAEAKGLDADNPPVGVIIMDPIDAPIPNREPQRQAALAKAATILTLYTGEEFLEFKEALSDIRSLRQEHRDLNGGGPGWAERNRAAWAKADELFANEDEAADQRRIEDFYG